MINLLEPASPYFKKAAVFFVIHKCSNLSEFVAIRITGVVLGKCLGECLILGY